MITVGEFQYDPAKNSIIGPKHYLDEQGEALLQRITTGDDLIFNITATQSPDVMTAILVRLQTDYAGWLGMKRLFAELGIAESQSKAGEPNECDCCNTEDRFVLDQDGACARCRTSTATCR